MSFGEFVSSGFGLWVDDAAEGSTTVLKQEKHVSWGDDRKYFQANAADNRQDESYCQIGEISTETRDIEELALTLVEERNQLLKLLEQAQAEVNTLKTENTDLRNENKFRYVFAMGYPLKKCDDTLQ